MPTRQNSDAQVITAEQISFTVVSEEEVEDGMGRMVSHVYGTPEIRL